VSCKETSIAPLASTTPVTPPATNINKNPYPKIIGEVKYFLPPVSVASQLKTFIPVGTAISIVAEVKYPLVATSIPTVYI